MRDIDRVVDLVAKLQEILHVMQVTSQTPMCPVMMGAEEVEMVVAEPLATYLVEALELLDEFQDGSTEIEFEELSDSETEEDADEEE